MSYNRLTCAAALLVISTISAAFGQQLKSGGPAMDARVRQNLAAAEQRWLDAYYKLDREALATMESDDFTVVTPSMSLGKTDQLDMVKRRATLSSPPAPAGEGCSVRNQNIRLFGTVALISDICTIKQAGDNPVTTPGSYWQTQLWQQVNGAWKIVYLHISPLEHGM
jgi:ketosteroid isomerase-like protein